MRYTPGTRPVRASYANSPNDNNRYDALQVQFLIDRLREGDTAIDVGAHCGQYCVLMSALCGLTGNVVAFAPDRQARKQLIQNVKLNPSLKQPTIEAPAVSDVRGEALFYSRGGNSLSSLARGAIDEAVTEDVEASVVPLVTLDTYVREKSLPLPRVIKIDAESAEIPMLKGAPMLLAGETEIVCELHPSAWEEFGNSFEELKTEVISHHTEIGSDVKYGTVLLERLP